MAVPVDRSMRCSVAVRAVLSLVPTYNLRPSFSTPPLSGMIDPECAGGETAISACWRSRQAVAVNERLRGRAGRVHSGDEFLLPAWGKK